MSPRKNLFFEILRGDKLRYAGTLTATIIATLFSFVAPLVLRFAIDSVIGDEPANLAPWLGDLLRPFGGPDGLADTLWVCSIAVVLFTIGNGLFSYLHGRWSAVASESIAQRIRDRLYDHLQHLSFDYHVHAETGDLIQRATSDVETIRRFLAIQLVEVGRALAMVAVAVPLMLSVDIGLTLVSVPIIPIVVLFSFFFFKKVQVVFKRSDEAEGRMSVVLQENLSGVRVVRAFARQRFEADKFEARNREYTDLTYGLIRLLAGYWSISDFLSMAQIGVILLVGTHWGIEGRITIGTLLVFLTYEGMLLWPLRQMGRILADMGKATVAFGRIAEVLETQREPRDGDAKPDVLGHIELRGVGFSYPKGPKILDDVSFSIKPGETLAILGPTGSGKTSLVHLLPRLYDYQEGSIGIDGVELKTIDKEWIRRNIAIVLQEPFLYAKTLRENIGLARREAQEAQLFEAARTASVHDVILAFDKGYETPVGERGVTLSGGQKQRVAIARALVQEAPILIFDDSLSAVDTETDMAIRDALVARGAGGEGAGGTGMGPTTIIISHRLSTVQNADRIVVLEGGAVRQIGDHDSLIGQEGLYRRVWEIQNSLEDELAKELGTTPIGGSV